VFSLVITKELFFKSLVFLFHFDFSNQYSALLKKWFDSFTVVQLAHPITDHKRITNENNAIIIFSYFFRFSLIIITIEIDVPYIAQDVAKDLNSIDNIYL
jgi:hypothetical protein